MDKFLHGSGDVDVRFEWRKKGRIVYYRYCERLAMELQQQTFLEMKLLVLCFTIKFSRQKVLDSSGLNHF